MNLRFRRTLPEDFPACVEILRDGYAFHAAERKNLPALWQYILENGLGESAVVEDKDNNADERAASIVAFGISVFVTDVFMAELHGKQLPWVATEVLSCWQAGQSPILSREALSRVNAGAGLNLLVLHGGHDRSLQGGSAAYYQTARTSLESFFAVHAGYRIKEVLAEAYGPSILNDYLNGGFRLRTDYVEHFARLGQPVPSADRRPYLTGLTRQEALSSPGYAFSALFITPEPQFGLTPAEQRLLWLALEGVTDEELASALSLSASTIKKRWQAIYDRVDRACPSLLPQANAANTNTHGRSTRGLERRRYLLLYLRDHREELRPFSI